VHLALPKRLDSVVKFRIGMMNRKFTAVVALSVLTLTNLGAGELDMVIDNLKYSRDFYSRVHFVAVAKAPQEFKYDRYPSDGPERIQCNDGTYLRQHGKAWVHVGDRMRTGLPIDYAERARYVMTFAGKDSWGRTGEPVDKETARKLDGWIKLVDAALNAAPATVKLANVSEVDGRSQWIFDAPSENPNGAPSRFSFRRPISDKKNVLLHEFSGSMRLEGDKVVPSGAADSVQLGFGYMMNFEGGQEVSEFVWEEMQQRGGEKGSATESPTPAPTATPSSGVLYESPKGSYRLEKGPGKFSASVVSAKDPKQRQLLSLAPGNEIGSDGCAASPDEKWLVMRGELFQRTGPVKFVPFKKKGWFNTALEDFVEKTVHPPSRHWYWVLGGWSDDSSHLAIGLSWPDGGEANIFLNMRTGEFEKK
jgi:hypothetical protein